MVLAWDARARTQYPIQTMHEAKDSVSCIAVRRWQILTGSIDRCVRIYDIRKGEMLEDYIGYPVTSVGISFDGQCVLVASQDSTIRLMDAMNGELLSNDGFIADNSAKVNPRHEHFKNFNFDDKPITSSLSSAKKILFLYSLCIIM
ncbi:unnamed protein product [Dibothriocephalus latus]|uniref:WD repeat domain-containing protein 83 n=1 Tax=Dibothriocephalus latus TaxID=60516 RepID=A0A3P7NTW1_DIBLA|nr:unnamed protein product [Dibothriocephalus latus]